jgi:urease accessory protein
MVLSSRAGTGVVRATLRRQRRYASVAAAAASAETSRWALMQMTDASLPTGGFAHSAGLEAAWQQGRVADTQQLLGFVNAAVSQAAHTGVPFVAAARDAASGIMTALPQAQGAALRDWADVDARHHALMCGNATAARASKLQGAALLRVAEPLLADSATSQDPSADSEAGHNRTSTAAARSALVQLQEAMRLSAPSPSLGGATVHGHHAPVFGLIGGMLQMPAEVLTEAYLFTMSRDLISAAVRLGIVGPMHGVALQRQLMPLVGSLLEEVDTLGINESSAAQTAPLIELLQGNHNVLYSRLFQS